jgi:Ca2+-binding EF-hand superfamily protein
MKSLQLEMFMNKLTLMETTNFQKQVNIFNILEVESCMKLLGMEINTEKVANLFKELDLNQDGKIPKVIIILIKIRMSSLKRNFYY